MPVGGLTPVSPLSTKPILLPLFRLTALRRSESALPNSNLFKGTIMSKLLSILMAAVFAAVTVTPALAQVQQKDQKKEQVHKGTAEQGTVQKKEQQKKKKAEAKKKVEEKK